MARNKKFRKVKKVTSKKRGTDVTNHRELIRLRGRSLAVGSIIVLGVILVLGITIAKTNPFAKLNPSISLTPKTVVLTPEPTKTAKITQTSTPTTTPSIPTPSVKTQVTTPITPTISGVMAQKSKPVVKKLPSTSSNTYVVQDGDSLARIGANVCGDKRAYLYLIEDFPFTLHPGNELHISCR